MNQNNIRWTAVKIFITPPFLIGVAISWYLVANDSFQYWLPFIIQVVVGLLAVVVTSWFLAPVVARWSARTRVPASLFGVFICAVGAIVFGFAGALVYPGFDIKSYVVKPVFWISLFGFPVAAITGLFFGAASRRLSSLPDPSR